MKKRIWMLPVLAGLLLSVGCKPQESITNVPTPKPETQRVEINQQITPPEHVIEVNGFGETIATPDFATIKLGVTAVADTAETATANCTELVALLTEQVTALDVAKEDIKTGGIDIAAELKPSDGTVTGYAASDNVTLIVRDVAQSNAVLSAILDQKLGELLSVSYSITDINAAYMAALAAAMQDAHTRAEAIAEAGGVRLGAVVGAVEAPFDDNEIIGVAFESSRIAVSAKVTVSYKIP